MQENAERPQLLTAGAFEHDDLSTVMEQVRAELEKRKLSVSKAVLLLPRAEVDVNSLQLPPSTDDELPAMVANSLAQNAEEASEETVHDFVRIGQADDTTDVLAFSASQDSLDVWSQRFKQQRIKLLAITFGGIGAVQLLQRVSSKPARTSMIVTTTDHDTNLAVVEEGAPILFRTIPRATDEQPSMIDQLSSDIKRTLNLVGHPEDEATRVYLIGSMHEHQDTAKALSDKLALTVSLVNPFDCVQGESLVEQPSRFANLIGCACAWNAGQVEIDLLHPRAIPTPPSPWRKIGFWGVIAASLVALGGYFVWEQNAEQNMVVLDQQMKLRGLIKPAQKAQSKQVVVKALDAWAASEVCWLEELQWLSSSMPPAGQATVSTLTMSADGTGGRIDMAMTVSEPDVRLQLEQAVRDGRHSISSKRVTDASSRTKPAWRFQSVISLAPSPPPSSAPKEDTPPAESDTSGATP